MLKLLNKLAGALGYQVQKKMMIKESECVDIREPEFAELYQLCRPYTMTSTERLYSVYSAVDYILKNRIPGDFVECGVWRGGCSMMIAAMLQRRQVEDRVLYMYDTYEGMSEPTEKDVDVSGVDAAFQLKRHEDNKEESVWCLASLEDVQRNLSLTGFPASRIRFIKGKVEDTLPATLPESIALLRLDTDWYASTRHELIHLYPLLVKNGVLIVDDYGHWEGCRQAVDEYLAAHGIPMLLHRIDYTGRAAVKVQ